MAAVAVADPVASNNNEPATDNNTDTDTNTNTETNTKMDVDKPTSAPITTDNDTEAKNGNDENGKDHSGVTSISEPTQQDEEAFVKLLRELTFELEEPAFHTKSKWQDLYKIDKFMKDPRFQKFDSQI